jgi:hypothetical protein
MDFEVGAFREVAADNGETEFAGGGFEVAVEGADGVGGESGGGHDVGENPRGVAAHGRDVGDGAGDGFAGDVMKGRGIEEVVVADDRVGGGEEVTSVSGRPQDRTVVAGTGGDVRALEKARKKRLEEGDFSDGGEGDGVRHG